MVTKEEQVLISGLSAAFTKHGSKMDVALEMIYMKLDGFKEALVKIGEILEHVIYEKPTPKPEPEVIITQEGHAIAKPVESKPKKEFENVKGDKVEFEFMEYENREGQKNSYIIYHPDSKQMVKYIGKSLIFNGGVEEDGFLYLKKGLGWVLEKEWTVKKAS